MPSGLGVQLPHRAYSSPYKGLHILSLRDVRNKEAEVRKAVQRKREHKVRNREHVLAHLRGHPCVDCGEGDVLVLEFDHLRDKDARINDCIRRAFSINRLQNEMDKCEVVCANCHRRRTYGRLENCYRFE